MGDNELGKRMIEEMVAEQLLDSGHRLEAPSLQLPKARANPALQQRVKERRGYWVRKPEG